MRILGNERVLVPVQISQGSVLQKWAFVRLAPLEMIFLSSPSYRRFHLTYQVEVDVLLNPSLQEFDVAGGFLLVGLVRVGLLLLTPDALSLVTRCQGERLKFWRQDADFERVGKGD